MGKSTLFNALARAQVMVSNYPFCTIDPNVGVVPVPDERLKKIQQIMGSPKALPAVIEFFDIAGLVKGAHKGEGLGNQFLSHIREVDALAQVVRCFKDEQIVHVMGEVDPRRDVETVNLELILADLIWADKKVQALRSSAKTGDPKILKELKLIESLREHLDQGKPARTFPELITDLPLLTLRPVLYVANVDESGNSEKVRAIEEIAKKEGSPVLIICSKLEADLSEMEPAEAQEYMRELGIKERGLDRLIKAGYELLQLITFFTANEKEARAWTIKTGTKAPQAAGCVHSDMERGFIAAEVAHYRELLQAGSYLTAREQGRLHTEGREYKVQDGDLMLFRFNP